MAELTKALLLQSLDAWGRYADAFDRLSADEQASFLSEQGFGSLHDILAHVAAWWQEALGVIRDLIQRGERTPRKYDMDAFNAEALARFKSMPDQEMLAWYESQRREMIAVVSVLTDEQMHIPRVASWLDGVILEHLKQHSADAPRFLVTDMLEREWAGAVARFQALPEDQQAAFLQKQGFARFRDLIAHVLAWWDEGIRLFEAGGNSAVGDIPDVDAFNAAAVAKYDTWDEPALFAEYEVMRQTLINLADSLPDEVYQKPNVQDWLRSDVLQHYYDHAV